MADEEITPGERRELRSVVKQQIKVLRAEVEQRKMELQAEVSTRLAEKYRHEDERANEFRRQVDEITEEANRQMRDVMAEHESLFDDGRWQGRAYFSPPHVDRKAGDRDELRKAMERGISAQAKQALLDLDRQEADLLRDLAMGGLETSAARAFLGRIPTVAELVPSRRLREIEAEFDQATAATET